MLAQVYYMQNEFKNIPDSILSNIDKMGINECLLLTELEGKYFNTLYKIDDRTFNLCGKKVGFFTGSMGKNKTNKHVYFTGERYRLNSRYSPNAGALYIFDEIQKEESGGYDAAIVYWSKMLIPVKDVVKRLKGKS